MKSSSSKTIDLAQGRPFGKSFGPSPLLRTSSAQDMDQGRPLIFKFGGTSLQTAERIHKVVDIIAGDQPLVVVISAVGGVTDLLVQANADSASLHSKRDEIERLHLQLARDLGLAGASLADYGAHLNETLADLSAEGSSGDGQARDLILSTGERLSTQLVTKALEARGVSCEYIDSRAIIRTDSNWQEARVDFATTEDLTRKALAPLIEKGVIPIVTGFLGSNEQGETTTIGRNGSDLTATLLGACLDAAQVWIWTDVDGIFTADPRYHRGTRLLSEISFREAAEAAYFGAAVIHPHTLWPLLKTDVAVRIKNTLNPEQPGTVICSEPSRRGNILITTSIDDVSVITVGGYGMVGVPGIAARIFSAVREEGTSVLMISQSSAEHNITFVIRNQEVPQTVASLQNALADWIEKDHRIDRIRVVPDVAVITVVGENMQGRCGIAGKIFTALGRNKINVIAIAQGSSEYSISMVLKAKDMREAVDSIHAELNEENGGN